MKSDRYKALASPLIFFCIALIGQGIYLLAFYPGILSFDSAYQWHQISTGEFTDWHPAYHTILIWLLTRIWYSPAVVAFFQVFVYSLVTTYSLMTFKKLRVSFITLLLLDLFVSINLITGLINITLWKDIIYSVLILLLTVVILNIILTRGEWINHKIHIIFLGFILANILLFRHNGLVVIILTPITLLLGYKKYWRQVLYATVMMGFYALLIKGPVYKIFQVDTEFSQNYAIALIHPIAAHISQPTDLTTQEEQYLLSIYPEMSWPYSCYDATVLFYKGIMFQPVMDDPKTALSIFLKLSKANPITTLKHFYCLSTFTWQIRQPKGVYLETVIFDSYDVRKKEEWEQYHATISQKPVLPAIKDLVINWAEKSLQKDADKVLWRPAFYMYVFLFAVLFAVVKTRNLHLMLVSVPMLSHTFGVMFTAQLQALRYQYPVYLISMLFVLPLIISSMKVQEAP